MLSNNARQRLCECLGLSEYEARLYISLLIEGTANARTLSMISGVPRTKVYSILRKLTDTGLVVEVPEEPRKFAPTPPRNAFKPYLRSYQNMVENFLSVISSLEEILRKPKSEQGLQQGTIWIINGRQEILRKIQQILSKAKRSVILVADESGIILLYKSFNRLFDQLAERSIKIKIITPADSTDQHILDELRYSCKIEETTFQLPLIFLFTDEKQLLMANLQPSSFPPKSEHDKGVFFDNAVLRQMICSLVLHEGWRFPLSIPSNERRKDR